MPVMGSAVLLLKTLTATEERAPNPICKPPISADALPAFLLNGAIARADVLGNVKPWQHKNRKMRIMELSNHSSL